MGLSAARWSVNRRSGCSDGDASGRAGEASAYPRPPRARRTCGSSRRGQRGASWLLGRRFPQPRPCRGKAQTHGNQQLRVLAVHAGLLGRRVFPVMGPPEVVTDETVPFGEVDVHRGERVRASDGEIGHIEGLVIDSGDRRVTHVLLEVRHALLGHKHVTIPIDTVAGVAAGVEVNLTKQQVHDLPSVEIERSERKGIGLRDDTRLTSASVTRWGRRCCSSPQRGSSASATFSTYAFPRDGNSAPLAV